jgi:hypothetical protein
MNPTSFRHLKPTLLCILLLSIVFSWLCVRTSLRMGRLSNVPNYDDIVYFASAADLLQSVRENGLSGAADFALRDGLHSPYCTAVAAVAFSIEGIRNAAPYRMNLFLVVAYLSVIAYFFRQAEFHFKVLAFLFFLTLPFATMAVVEFRPDLAWATLLGFSAVFAMTREDLFQSWKVALCQGVLVGLSLLVKPSTFAMTLAVSAMALGFAWLLEISRNGLGRAFSRLFPTAGVVLLALIALAGPYYAVFGREVWRYFIDNSFGVNATVWNNPGDPLTQWLFYIYGPGSRSNLGSQELVIFAALLGFGFLRSWKGGRTVRLQTLLMIAAVAIIFVVNAVARMKSPFLGGAFYGTLLFSTAFLAGEFFSALPAGSKQAYRFALGAFIIVTLNAAFIYHWPEYSHWPKHQRNKAFIAAENAMKEFVASAPTPKNIVFTQAGPVTPENIKLLYFRRKERCNMTSAAFCRSLDEFQKVVATQDVVVTQDKGTLGGSDNMPSEALEDDFVGFLSHSADFKLAKTIPILGEKGDWRNVYVFVKQQP